ncbi:hypothetical protein D9C73_021823 [Collichthys lucidus]|uniref:Uncharacterized protein n=1 Tax=Collichthys lucidus TaxID=240159 RepID=A0A4U5VHY2_COLLU|nr:hypothetical protein D9C73_021823 [Collichthys lucidus]
MLPHVRVNQTGDGSTGPDHRASSLKSLIIRLSPSGLFVCPCRCLSLCCLSTPPIIIIIFPFLLLLLLPGSPLGCEGSQLGQGGGDRRVEERREDKEEEEEDRSEVPALFHCRRRTEPKT